MEKNVKFSRKNRMSAVEALTEAQKIAFAPFTFQALAAMIDFKILETLSKAPKTKEEIKKECKISEYAVDTLFDAALCAGLLKINEDGTYSNTKLADAFLYDEMTRVNFNFVKDVCYLGASELEKSFKTGRPEGLHKYFFDSETIYPMITKMNAQMKKSWYEFDHHYSDDCFDEVLGIIFEKNPKTILDIGGNTGKFENACLNYNPDCTVFMFDLPENIEAARAGFDTPRCRFISGNILDEGDLSADSGKLDAVFMSQFLDCFSKEQILFILNRVAGSIDEKTRVYILEPFIDNQRFKGAAYALSHISFYFTCMANGKSKMYNEADFVELIEKSGLKIDKAHHNIGKYDYTLLECVKK